jgi:hypothetical protein
MGLANNVEIARYAMQQGLSGDSTSDPKPKDLP